MMHVYAFTTVDGLNTEPLPPGSVIEVIATSSSGQEIRTFADKDGLFWLREVPPGTHIVSAYNIKFVFPEYYEPRKPLDIRGIVMSPYGLMIGFSVFIMVVMPMMKMDPEEYREAMSSISGGGAGASGGQAGGGAAIAAPQGLGAVTQRRAAAGRGR
ncbi:hypothetical protein MNEG_8272 [Monoraphidium neglectum]|uniref:ER membrane protein complex subunit 7 beta-sandwich domain-containing protein n=1 Tax=Monoraphidium neglectum TaxID=145388 RepID=A0A0D2KWS6_9CHLO|nr:hypothetical protein MNEG_8272 [Monoraphidium neglectum]KIY99693.1 hypothetical protein MNEG_8272 [Monoraphidium neglectum]|eukprot:XP_013898713.1 hypothetical protein MNEG_8272 [Monoraphidium neglectum]